MGRKMGSKNKKHKKTARPKKPCVGERSKHFPCTERVKFKAKWKKKIYPESKYAREERLKQLPQPISLKTYKLLGFCPKCGLTLGEGDLEKGKKGIVICPACGYREKVSKILKEPIRKDKVRSKKEFLEESQEILESMPKINEEHEPPEEIGRLDLSDD